MTAHPFIPAQHADLSARTYVALRATYAVASADAAQRALSLAVRSHRLAALVNAPSDVYVTALRAHVQAQRDLVAASRWAAYAMLGPDAYRPSGDDVCPAFSQTGRVRPYAGR